MRAGTKSNGKGGTGSSAGEHTRPRHEIAIGYMSRWELRRVVEDRIEEFNGIDPEKAPAMAVVCLGSIVEAMLLDVVFLNQPLAAHFAELEPGNDFALAGLATLVTVAKRAGLLQKHSPTFARVLTEYRNLIRPHRAARESANVRANKYVVSMCLDFVAFIGEELRRAGEDGRL